MPNSKAYSDYLKRFGFQTDDVPTTLPPNDLAQTLGNIRRNMHRVEEQYTGQMDDMLRAFEENTANLLMQNMSKDLVKRFTQLGFPKQLDSFTGVFPTNSFNAQAVRLSDGALILIDVGCFVLIEALTMLWAWDNDRERSVSVACRIIIEYLSDYILPNPHEYDHPSLHDGGRAMAFATLVSKAEEFVLAHEHAHVALGHIWSAECKSISTPVGKADFTTKSHEQEIDADRLGVHAMFPVKKKADDLTVRQIGAAPYIVFGIAHLLEKTNEIVSGRKYENWDSHPPAIGRLVVVEKQLEAWYFSKLLDLGQKFFGWIDECVEYLKHTTADTKAIRKEIHQKRFPKVSLPSLEGTARVGVYVRTSVLTTKYDSHEKELLEYCLEQSWEVSRVYRDRKGENIDKNEMNVLLEGERKGMFKEGGFEFFFGLINAVSGRKSGGFGIDGGLFEARNQMLRDAQGGQLDTVVVYDLGRLGPNKLAVFQCVKALQDAGVTVIVPHIGVLGNDTIYPAGLDYD